MMGTIRALTVFTMLWVPSAAAAAVVQIDSEADLIQKSDAIVVKKLRKSVPTGDQSQPTFGPKIDAKND